jgi:hypothetical protein
LSTGARLAEDQRTLSNLVVKLLRDYLKKRGGRA